MPPVIFLLAVAVFAQGTSEFMLAGLLPAIAADLGIGIPQAGLLTSAFAVGMVVGAPLMAAISRRWSPRLALSGFLVIFILMHVLGALTDEFAVLLISRIVAALTNAGFLAVTLSTVSALVPQDRTARALAVILGGTTLALIAGVPGGAVLGSLFGWRSALWAVAIISVPALIAVVIATPRAAGSGSPVASGSAAAPGRAEASGTQAVRLTAELAVLRRGTLLFPLGLGALVNGATFCAFTYVAPVVTEAAQLPTGVVPLILAIFGVGSFAGVWAAGRFGDLHSERILVFGGMALFLGWCAFFAGAHLPAVVFSLALVQGALSFAVGSTLIATSIRAAASAPTMSGSFATASLNIGAAAGPVLGGLAYASAAGALGPLAVSAALVGLAALVFALGRGRGPGRP
ncbi:Cmx/CmrA family chloramphenicol efflux MFS transporter [Galactobacter caseinivorans]|uniref:MFS transporter n=1 Tax=Galactobacter caseinivorans TaxID=2676123 RepID=A0A496PFR8_9MICC|nr:Cmx/CmrA family chloramphenicol efflux MFS transporter [Galactobacter caseinivorans]RKW69496.1 MFS transporter [Galactobacter caseinivorans]